MDPHPLLYFRFRFRHRTIQVVVLVAIWMTRRSATADGVRPNRLLIGLGDTTQPLIFNLSRS